MAQKKCSETFSLFEINETNELVSAVEDWIRPEGTRIFGVDYGASGHSFALIRDDDPAEKRIISAENFIKLSFAKSGDYVIIEHAHVQPRNTRVSLSQPLTYDELVRLKNNAEELGVQIRIINQCMTYKFRNSIYGEDSKNDHNDAHALIIAAQVYGLHNLHKLTPRPQKTFTHFQDWCHLQIKEMNDLLNLWRMQYDTTQSPCLILFEKYLIHVEQTLMRNSDPGSRLALRWFFGKNASMDGKTSVTLSLWVALFDWNGNPRFYKNKTVSIPNTMSYLLVNKPFHHKGGVARSNIWKFGFKRVCTDLGVPDIIDRSSKESQSYLQLQSAKSKYRKAMKATLKAMRLVHAARTVAC